MICLKSIQTFLGETRIVNYTQVLVNLKSWGVCERYADPQVQRYKFNLINVTIFLICVLQFIEPQEICGVKVGHLAHCVLVVERVMQPNTIFLPTVAQLTCKSQDLQLQFKVLCKCDEGFHIHQDFRPDPTIVQMKSTSVPCPVQSQHSYFVATKLHAVQQPLPNQRFILYHNLPALVFYPLADDGKYSVWWLHLFPSYQLINVFGQLQIPSLL